MITHVQTTLPLVITILIALTCHTIYRRVRLESQRKSFKQQHGCQPAHVVLRSRYPFEILFKVIDAAKKHRVQRFFHEQLSERGGTFTQHVFGKVMITSNDAENIKTAFATRADDWIIEPMREAAKPLIGNAIFTTDGAFWHHSRSLLRPQFEKQQVADVHQFEAHVSHLMARIPTDGSTFDLAKLFQYFSMDTSSEFLTGTSTSLLSDPEAKDARRFAEAVEESFGDILNRQMPDIVYYFMPHDKAKKANKDAKEYIMNFVERALNKSKVNEGSESEQLSKSKYVFLYELAKHDEVDATRLRDEIMGIFVAGRDTTAALLSSLWFALAKEPEAWETLQAEVDELQGELPTYEKLRNMQYLRYCTQETLRLYPPAFGFPKRAFRDTVLPHGGGADGKTPLFVAKGSDFIPIIFSAMREVSVYGEDAEKFNPSRWADPSLRPGWNYTPFGGGPRACLGQQYALTETYYVTVRLMQHFRRIESRDPEEWAESMTIAIGPSNGTQVALMRE